MNNYGSSLLEEVDFESQQRYENIIEPLAFDQNN